MLTWCESAADDVVEACDLKVSVVCSPGSGESVPDWCE